MAAAQSTEDEEIKILGDYLEKRYGYALHLGGGCNGTVFEVPLNDSEGSVRVVKCISCGSSDRREDAEREAGIQEELSGHPNICTLYEHWYGGSSAPTPTSTYLVIADAGTNEELSNQPDGDGPALDTDPDFYFLVMEKLDKTLGDHVEEKRISGELAEDKFNVIVLQCCEGLQHMHDNRYAHIDINEYNVMVGGEGSECKVKWIDFETAKKHKSDENLQYDIGIDIRRLHQMFTQEDELNIAELFSKVVRNLLKIIKPGDSAHEMLSNLDDMNLPSLENLNLQQEESGTQQESL